MEDAYESELENSSEVILLDDDSEEDNLRFISFEEIEEAMDINLQAEELLLLPSQKSVTSIVYYGWNFRLHVPLFSLLANSFHPCFCNWSNSENTLDILNTLEVFASEIF